ncbi:MAG: hypothetical protein HYX24_07010 [Candidatus Aenigmarchaeota archaeon]|nr:hypothetical protein [Candidatus Aenigmarchaeota archaeon]
MIAEFAALYAHEMMKFILPELLFMLSIRRSGARFKFRFSTIEKIPALKPFTSIWSVATAAIIIYLLSIPLYDFLLGGSVYSWLISLGLLKLFSLSTALTGFSLLFVVHYMFEKAFDRQTMSIFFAIVLSLTIFVVLYFH